MKKFPLYIFLFLLNGAIIANAQSKLISVAQQGPDTRLLKKHYKTWEKTLPFTGLSIGFNDNTVNNKTSIGLYGKADNELCFSVFDNKKNISYNNYTNAINDLNSCNFFKFKNNFLMLSIFNQSWVQWDDDAAWGHLLANLEVAAKIAKDSGLTGIILDTEMYGSPQNLNLIFYCQQFVNKIYIKEAKVAYVIIKNQRDHNVLEDLFPKENDIIYWKGADDIINNVKLAKVFLNIYKDNNGNFYYPLIDPKYKDDVKAIINNVEKRGAEIISAISKNFSNAEVLLTVGPSSIKYDLNIYGLNSNNSFYRTGSGLLIPFVKGMLRIVNLTHVKLIDGQEHTYYYKTENQFRNAHKNFINVGNYYCPDVRSIYLKNMHEAVGLYPRPAGVKTGNGRFFTPIEITNALRFATSIPGIKYIWIYEELESYWFINSLSNCYMAKKTSMSKIGGENFDSNIENIKRGLKK